MYGKECNTEWVIRSFMRKKPFRFVLEIFLLGIVFFGYALRIAESPLTRKVHDMDHNDFMNCCWEAILVMTTGKISFKNVELIF